MVETFTIKRAGEGERGLDLIGYFQILFGGKRFSEF